MCFFYKQDPVPRTTAGWEGGTVTGPRDHLLSVDEIRLVKEARGTAHISGKSGELGALAAVPGWGVRVNMKGPCEEVQKNDQEGAAAATGPQAETLEAKRSWTADSHAALGTEGASSPAWGPGWTPHLRIFLQKRWEGSGTELHRSGGASTQGFPLLEEQGGPTFRTSGKPVNQTP